MPPPLTPAFKLAVTVVTSLTVLSLAVCVFLALAAPKGDEVNALFETCSTTFKMGFGALVGLVGGKAL